MGFRTHRATASSGAIATTLAPAYPWELHEIRLHFSGSLAATAFTATMDAGAGALYDTLVYSKSAASISADLVKTFETPLRFTHYNDQVDFAYANGSGAKYGLEIIYKPLG